jgi:F5/8 type C domain
MPDLKVVPMIVPVLSPTSFPELATKTPGVTSTNRPTTTATYPATPPAQPTASPTLNPPPQNLDQIPLYWFAPLPPMPTSAGRPFIGSEDFMALFKPDSPWKEAASHIQVFKLYGEWVAYHASDAELRQVVQDLEQRRLALAVEAGPLNASSSCGEGVESFAGVEEGLRIAQRIKQAGGTLHLIALDEPYFFGHFYDGPHTCRWTDQYIAQQVGKYIQAMRTVFPDVRVGDTEPLADGAGAAQYQAWIVAFQAVNGYNLDFLHLDVDWNKPNWPQQVKAIEEFGKVRGVPVGLIYTGNWLDANDEAWISIAGERVKQYEIATEGKLEHVLFQSWHDKPDRVLPESDPYTFTGFIRNYFEDKSRLGLRQTGAGANLAYHKPVRFSTTLPGNGGELAVDGNPGTWWSAGASAPQWIEVDLGAVYNIQSIRLVISQSPSGLTVHKIRGKGASLQDTYTVLYTFEGVTDDNQVLSYTPDQPWKGIRYLRVETLDSPSWVAWREIEIIDAGNR